jgi:hypothetical protein
MGVDAKQAGFLSGKQIVFQQSEQCREADLRTGFLKQCLSLRHGKQIPQRFPC